MFSVAILTFAGITAISANNHISLVHPTYIVSDTTETTTVPTDTTTMPKDTASTPAPTPDTTSTK
ncbi:hypothetical protein ADIARSV_2741 [Arcticibacter svalbardensis MN12-7]|uniref:Uncharacterized protein n=2 Tax=Arcticibacter TaxID=1288026 RepID=R9GR08_9SPHI|nr:hypothetical protein ADIARSV_2741 [Arcticibacter svalbardensis MN12-7]